MASVRLMRARISSWMSIVGKKAWGYMSDNSELQLTWHPNVQMSQCTFEIHCWIQLEVQTSERSAAAIIDGHRRNRAEGSKALGGLCPARGGQCDFQLEDAGSAEPGRRADHQSSQATSLAAAEADDSDVEDLLRVKVPLRKDSPPHPSLEVSIL